MAVWGDLPGSPDSDVANEQATIHVRGVLLGKFLVQETTGVFDKGLDLLVMPRSKGRALPAIAALQVKGGDSQRSIRVGRHGRYWAEMPMPVFGVTVPDSTPPRWVDLRAYLRAEPTARMVRPREPLETLADAIRAACDEHAGLSSVINLGASEEVRQLGALLALWPLRHGPEVAALVRGRLPRLAALPTRLALELLATSRGDGSHDGLASFRSDELVAVVDHVLMLRDGRAGATSILGEYAVDSWRLGATYLWELITKTGTPVGVVLDAAERSSDPDCLDLCVHIAACMQPARATQQWITTAIAARPGLAGHRDLLETFYQLNDGPLDFPVGI